MGKACGKEDCYISSSIDEITLTFGSGELDDFGFWEHPCFICASTWKEKYPENHVWPTKPKKYKVNAYLLVEADEPEIYNTKEEAEMEAAHCRYLQPENKYEIEEIEDD